MYGVKDNLLSLTAVLASRPWRALKNGRGKKVGGNWVLGICSQQRAITVAERWVKNLGKNN